MFVCSFVCLFAVNAKTTAWIDAKRSGITKNDPESVLCVLKSPVLVFLGRYRDISGFSFADDRHFYISHFHFRFLCRRLTTTAKSPSVNGYRSALKQYPSTRNTRWLHVIPRDPWTGHVESRSGRWFNGSTVYRPVASP